MRITPRRTGKFAAQRNTERFWDLMGYHWHRVGKNVNEGHNCPSDCSWL